MKKKKKIEKGVDKGIVITVVYTDLDKGANKKLDNLITKAMKTIGYKWIGSGFEFKTGERGNVFVKV